MLPLLTRSLLLAAALTVTTVTAVSAQEQPPSPTTLPATRPSTREGGAGIEMPPVTRPFSNPLKGIEASKRTRNIVKALTPLSDKLKNSVGTIEEKDGRELALATVVRSDGYLLSKASELESGYTYKIRMASGLVYDATVTAIADLHDIALLHVNAANLQPVEWISTKEARVGEIVFSAGPQKEPLSFGVVSVGVRASTGGAIGVGFPEEADTPEGVRIQRVEPNFPAAAAGLQAGDLIQKINDQDFTEREKLSEFLQNLSAGTEISITVKRGDTTLVFRLTLASRSRLNPQSSRSVSQNDMGSILSRRKSDFAAVLQHDTVLMAFQQGSPLVDLDGKTLGINIARAGRVETYAIPSDVIQTILPDLINGKYPKENPAVEARIAREKKEVEDAKRKAELTEKMKKRRLELSSGSSTQPTTKPSTTPHPQLGIDPNAPKSTPWNNGDAPRP